ncbi:SPOR domain-containing protein [Alteromonas gracilis]|uniref:SPOR domain-containing protein n=1 Tax=Alteromonas gracilis TaxID=1479524 RepID=UPI003734FCAD
MQSELHERLEYLVNYSSQLIFVSGESIAQQQKTLEAFVFQQHDDTEIAYLTAQENMEPSDYRRQLCRQLLGQVVGSFVRPLNELLSDLNRHEGPILIAITQAHHLPDALLQELWNLVLQSRFAGNKQHLNVLLFANNDWAERAKQWLPAKNTETPLIISSQSVMSEQPNFESELDKMIASRREAFQAHLENRQRENTQTFTNPLKTKWFYLAVACVFLTTFSGLIYWQYGDKLGSIFAPIEQQSDEPDNNQVVPGSAYKTLIGHEETDKSDSASGAENTELESEILSASPAPKNNEGSQSFNANLLSDTNNSRSTDTVETDGDSLVTNWETAVSSLPQVPTPSEQQANSQPLSNAQSVNEATSPLNNKDIDGTAALEQTRLSNDLTTSDKSPTNNAPAAQESWISANDYAIQMLAMKSESVLNAFLNENNLSEKTRIYKTIRYGGEWFVVVHKSSYASLSQAQQARSALPEYPGKQNAFIKRGDQILSEMSKAQN